MKGKVLIWVAALLFAGSLLNNGVVAAQKKLTVAFDAGISVYSSEMVIPDFEKAHPDIKIEVVSVPYTAYGQKVPLELAAGSGTFDMVGIGADTGIAGTLIASGWVIPLDKYIEESDLDLNDYIPAFLANGTLGGKAVELNPAGTIYGLPTHGDVRMFYYRKDLYAKLGLTPPKTWEELLQNVIKVNDPEKDFYGMVLALNMASIMHVVADYMDFVLGMDGYPPIGEGHRPQFDSPPMIRALQFENDLVRKYKVTPPGIAEYSFPEKNIAIAQGKAGHMFQWMVGSTNTTEDPSRSKVAGKLGYTFAPEGLVQTGGWVLAITNTCKYPKDAFEYVKFFSHDCDPRRVVVHSSGGVLRTLDQYPEVVKRHPYIGDFIKAASKGKPPYLCAPDLPNWRQILEIITRGVIGVVLEELPVEATLKEMNEEITEAVKEVGYLD